MEQERARAKQLEITVPDEITVSELAIRLKKTSAEVIKKLMMMGEMKGLNDVIDYGTAEIIADEFGAKVTKEVVVTIEEKLFTEADDNEIGQMSENLLFHTRKRCHCGRSADPRVDNVDGYAIPYLEDPFA